MSMNSLNNDRTLSLLKRLTYKTGLPLRLPGLELTSVIRENVGYVLDIYPLPIRGHILRAF